MGLQLCRITSSSPLLPELARAPFSRPGPGQMVQKLGRCYPGQEWDTGIDVPRSNPALLAPRKWAGLRLASPQTVWVWILMALVVNNPPAM